MEDRPSPNRVIPVTQLPNPAQPADLTMGAAAPMPTAGVEATADVEPTADAEPKPATRHSALIALVRLLARQAAEEQVAAEVVSHG
jgi:hypothetical protein